MPPISSNPTVPNNPFFFFVADSGFKPWSGSSIEQEGVGGSETYIIELATYIRKLTNFEVVVFCRCQKEESYKEVSYVDISQFASYAATFRVEYCVISRYSEYIPIAVDGHVENIYVVLHDLNLTSRDIPVSPKIKNFFCLSEWHRDLWARNYPQFDAITKPFHYGVDFRLFHRSTQNKVPGRFIFSSFANRGLKTVLQLWPRLFTVHPHISLHIFCDLENHWLLEHYAQEVEEIKAMLQDYNQRKYNIINFGWVSKQRLAEAWAGADVWFYPCKFAETFCLTALEAAITKTMVITNDLAALKDTVGDRGIVIPGDATTEEWKETAFIKVCNYLQNSQNVEFAKLKSKNYKWACTHNWEDRARDLLENYVLLQPIENHKMLEPNNKAINKATTLTVNDCGMKNWTHDLPTNSKQIFLGILDYLVHREDPINVLEVGTYAGTSLIAILQHLPNSFGTAVDAWTDYKEHSNFTGKSVELFHGFKARQVEEIFDANMRAAKLEDCVERHKGDSAIVLAKLIEAKKRFDFIYVDGSHKALDCFADLVMTWHLLKPNGILAIDDYPYNAEYDLWESPFNAVNRFLTKFKDQYLVLSKQYRVFLLKQ